MVATAYAALAIVACSIFAGGAGCGDLGGLGADTGGIAPLDPVFVCELAGGSADVELELCWQHDDAAELAGLVADHCGGTVTCSPSPRVPGGFYHCTGGTGCDAFEGCWCPRHMPCVPVPR